MERYKVTLAYDGTHFKGFQRQGAGERTVQAEIEAALRHFNWEGGAILVAGRTDSGVHASGQVIAFDLDWAHSSEALCRAMNDYLPPDIAVSSVSVMTHVFHPRNDARRRSYRYCIYCQPERNPLRDRYAWRVWPAVDLNLLQSAAGILPGTYDFGALGTPPPRPGGSTIRTIYRSVWEQRNDELIFTITANAFLYHMVRRLVYLQVLVGQNKLSGKKLVKSMKMALPLVPGIAPPQGLKLVKVQYTLDEQKREILADAD